MAEIIMHLAATQTKEGYARGMFCATASRRYAGTGRAGNTMDHTKVTCKRCLAKILRSTTGSR